MSEKHDQKIQDDPVVDTQIHKVDPDAEEPSATTVEVKLSQDSSASGTAPSDLEPLVEYKLYRRRWFGLAAIVLFNVVSGCNGQFFGPISVQASKDFQVTLSQMNWLSNAVNLAYLPASFLTSWILKRIGVRKTLLLGGVYLVIANWIRFAATAKSLPVKGAYALLLIAQLFIALAQPCVMIICVKYSELWFDLRGRMTSTMLTGISNPLGGVVGSLLLPALPSTYWAIVTGAIMATVLFPIGFLLQDKPPTPPTFSGSKSSPPMRDTFKAMIGKLPVEDPSYMELRDRVDFGILFFSFGVLVTATGGWSNFSNQIFSPYGYSAGQSGLMDATLLLSGIVASVVSAPLFDRYLAKYLSVTIRTFLPIIAGCWISFIWQIKPHNVGLFPTFVIIGMCSFVLLPIALELGAEVTRNAETSCTLLWFSVNLFSFIYIFIMDNLRSGPSANPPNNMRHSVIFNGAIVAFAAFIIVVGFRGKQSRRLADLARLKEAQQIAQEEPGRATVEVQAPAS